MPVILATCDTEIGKITVVGQAGANYLWEPHLQKSKEDCRCGPSRRAPPLQVFKSQSHQKNSDRWNISVWEALLTGAGHGRGQDRGSEAQPPVFPSWLHHFRIAIICWAFVMSHCNVSCLFNLCVIPLGIPVPSPCPNQETEAQKDGVTCYAHM
jgi:hypothetical protein